MILGTLAKTKDVPMVKPEGREYEVPIGLVELTAAGVTVCLSDVVKAARRFAAIPGGRDRPHRPLDLPVD